MSTPTTRILARAAEQHGVVTRKQALEAGLSSGRIGRRLATREWTGLHVGVYRVGPIPAPLEWAAAAVLAAGPSARLSHLTAARLWGWTHVDAAEAPDDPVQVLVEKGRPRRRPGIEVHRGRLDADERDHRHALPVTGAGRTLVDAAALLSPRAVERMVARASRAGQLTDDELGGLPNRYRRRPGVVALRTVLGYEGGPALTRSEAELRFLELVRKAGLPAPSTNVPMGRYEADFLWPRERVVVEVDGYDHHRIRARFEGDRRKDTWLSAQGHHVIRTTWRQITQDGIRTVVEVAQALARASERRR